MKKLLCIILASAMCFAFNSCKENGNENQSSPSSATNTVSYLDISKSVYVPIFNQNEYQKRVFMDCDITIGDVSTKYIAAKSGDCKYIKYSNAEETTVYLFDGLNAYILNETDKTATPIIGIPASYGMLLAAFDSTQLNRFYETGSEKLNDTEYTYETFVTDGGYCKYYINGENTVKYMYNWNTGTSENTVTKVTFNELQNEPDISYFVLPEDYEITTQG